MRTKFTRMDVEAAKEDIRNHTLALIKNDFGRLIYLASTRDYNTGKYYHDGLAFQFSEPTAERALAACHLEVFERLLESPLEDFVGQLEGYLRSAYPDPSQTVDVWEKLQAYRATIPLHCGSLAAGLFVSHVKVALTILKAHQPSGHQDLQFASPHSTDGRKITGGKN